MQAIQSFGYIVVCNFNNEIIGISHHLDKLLLQPANLYLGKSIITLLQNKYFSTIKEQAIAVMATLTQSGTQRQSLSYTVANTPFQLNISKHDDNIYLEWEEQESPTIAATKTELLEQLLSNGDKMIWEILCSVVHHVIGYDQILLLRMNTHGIGKLITAFNSSKNSSMPTSYLEGFTHDMLYYYKSSEYRYLPNIFENLSTFTTLDKPIDLSNSHLVPFPDLHIKYLKSISIHSFISFPIFMSGKFWGMLAGYHDTPKKIDVHIRRYCAFLVQFAAHKYELKMLSHSLSHDLKNPLSILKIGAQILQKNSHLSKDDQLRWINSIMDSAQNIETIIDRLIQLGRSKSSSSIF